MANKYVLDTHPLVWYLESNSRLSKTAKAVIDDTNNRFVLPIIALAEAAFIVEHGRTAIPSVADLLQNVLADPRIEIYPLTWEVFSQSLSLSVIPEMHDRLIVGTALYLQNLGESVSIISKDSVITRAQITAVVW